MYRPCWREVWRRGRQPLLQSGTRGGHWSGRTETGSWSDCRKLGSDGRCHLLNCSLQWISGLIDWTLTLWWISKCVLSFCKSPAKLFGYFVEYFVPPLMSNVLGKLANILKVWLCYNRTEFQMWKTQFEWKKSYEKILISASDKMIMGLHCKQ